MTSSVLLFRLGEAHAAPHMTIFITKKLIYNGLRVNNLVAVMSKVSLVLNISVNINVYT